MNVTAASPQISVKVLPVRPAKVVQRLSRRTFILARAEAKNHAPTRLWKNARLLD